MDLLAATPAHAPALADLHAAVAAELGTRFGPGPWSRPPTEAALRIGLGRPRFSRTLFGREGGELVGALTLQTRRPWSIDPAYFTPVANPIYLVGLVVHPGAQGRGLGRQLLTAAGALAKEWPGDSLRLDAWDGAVGAGPFCLRCGFREVGRVVYRRAPLVYFERLV